MRNRFALIVRATWPALVSLGQLLLDTDAPTGLNHAQVTAGEHAARSSGA